MPSTLPRRIELADVTARIGEPSPLVAAKILDRLDDNARRFVASSPLLFLATSDADGNLDCSPRGDHPGFVAVLDDRLLAIPERPGNRLAQSLRNLAAHPGAGLVFVLPGRHETLRVNGRAYLSDEPDLLSDLAVRGVAPLVAVVVEVEEAYIHCGRPLLRAQLWDGDRDGLGADVPSIGRFVADALAENRPGAPAPTRAAIDEDVAAAYQQLY